MIAEDVEGEALATLIVNQIRGYAQELRRQGARLRRPPQSHVAGYRSLTGGQVISEELGIKLENVALNNSAEPSASSSTRTIRPSSEALATQADRRTDRANPP